MGPTHLQGSQPQVSAGRGSPGLLLLPEPPGQPLPSWRQGSCPHLPQSTLSRPGHRKPFQKANPSVRFPYTQLTCSLNQQGLRPELGRGGDDGAPTPTAFIWERWRGAKPMFARLWLVSQEGECIPTLSHPFLLGGQPPAPTPSPEGTWLLGAAAPPEVYSQKA